MITRVISGGQTGVDVAALRAAKSRGVATGGKMPKGFLTSVGPRPEWAREFGLFEHGSSFYTLRTQANVDDADVTVRIAGDFRSPGEVCTQRAAERSGKPLLDVRLFRSHLKGNPGELQARSCDVARAVAALRSFRRRLGRDLVVNFAGNSERTAPGIEAFAEHLVGAILDCAT